MERSLALLFVQVALGALVGGFVALEIATRFAYGSYLWSIGAFLGGFVAYWSTDPRQILAGIAHSYRRTINWRPNRLYWETFTATFGGMEIALATTIGGVLSACVIVLEWQPKGGTGHLATTDIGWGFGLMSGFIAFLVWAAMCRSGATETDEKYALRLKDNRNFGLKMMLYTNPIGILYWFFVGLLWLIVRIPSAVVIAASVVPPALYGIGRGIKMFALFVAGVFIYVHSERRVRRLMYATIGAMIGYALGHAIIGAFAGGVLAVVSYKLTPVRWLKIAPATRPL